jgi:predicted transcriptional regulator
MNGKTTLSPELILAQGKQARLYSNILKVLLRLTSGSYKEKWSLMGYSGVDDRYENTRSAFKPVVLACGRCSFR